MSALTAAVILAWVAIFVLALAVSGLTRAVGRIANEAAGNASPAHPLIGREAPTLAELGEWSNRTAMIFVDPTCNVCRERILDLKKMPQSTIDYLLVSTEPPDAFTDIGLNGMQLVQVDPPYVAFFSAYSKPFGVLIDENGLVVAASPLGNKRMLADLVGAGLEKGD